MVASNEERLAELGTKLQTAEGQARVYLAQIKEAGRLKELLCRIKEQVSEKDDTIRMLNAWMSWQKHKAQAAADGAQQQLDLERASRERDASEAASILSSERSAHLCDLDELAACKLRHHEAREELRRCRDAVSALVHELQAKVRVDGRRRDWGRLEGVS